MIMELKNKLSVKFYPRRGDQGRQGLNAWPSHWARLRVGETRQVSVSIIAESINRDDGAGAGAELAQTSSWS